MTTLSDGQSPEVPQTIRDNYGRYLNHAALAGGDVLSLADFAITQGHRPTELDESASNDSQQPDTQS